MVQTTDRMASDPGNFTTVGVSTQRIDGEEKITGRARYAGDLPLVGLLHARLVLSPYAHARLLSIDTTEALAIPGVVAVYTSETLGIVKEQSSARSFTPLAQDEVFWCGHPVAIVLGETEAAAEDGAVAVEVEYEPLPVVIDPLVAMRADAVLTRPRKKDESAEIAGGGAHADTGGGAGEVEEEEEQLSLNVSDHMHRKIGDIDAGWREAEVVVEGTYRTHPVHQSYMEPQAITVQPSANGQQLTVWPSSQGLFAVRSDIAEALDMPERNIHVESVPIGGAFGGKFGLYEPLAAAAAYTSRRAVRLVCSRQDDLLAGNPAPQSSIFVKLGAKRDGALVALQAKIVLDAGAYAGASVGLAALILNSTYRCVNVDIRGYEVLTNKVPVGAYRAPNAPQATFALESVVGDLCEALGMDPIEFRKLNALRAGDATYNPRRPQWPPIGLLECLEKAEQQPLWQERRARGAQAVEVDGWKVGIGLAVGGWPGGVESAAAACRLETDGTVSVVIGTVDLTGSDTSMALIAAEALGMSKSAVNIAHANTDTMPYSGGTGGSKTVYTMGPAVMAAARDARNQILAIASEMLEASVEDLEIADGAVEVRGVPGKSLSLKKIAAASMSFGAQYEPVYGRGRAAVSESSPMYGAHLAKVAVDTESGEVRVLDYTVVQDVGFAINPEAVVGQIQGGVTQGLGWALFEGLEYDEAGQLLTSTLMDYALPHSEDVPNITTIFVEVPSGKGPYGAKGVGEPPVIPVGATIADAIADAVGVRVTQLPITPERLFNALQGKR